MREWRIEIEIPALDAISDEPSWVVLRGEIFDNRKDAIEAYLKVRRVYGKRWLVRLRQIVQFQNYPDSTPFWRTLASSVVADLKKGS